MAWEGNYLYNYLGAFVADVFWSGFSCLHCDTTGERSTVGTLVMRGAWYSIWGFFFLRKKHEYEVDELRISRISY